MTVNNNTFNSIANNMHLVAEHANLDASHFRVVHHHKENYLEIKTNNIFQRIFYKLTFQTKQKRKDLHDLLINHARVINTNSKDNLINPVTHPDKLGYTPLFINAQKYNYALARGEKLFTSLNLTETDLVKHGEVAALEPLKLKAITNLPLLSDEIKQKNQPYIVEERSFPCFWKKVKHYHYNEEDLNHSNFFDGLKILFSTQLERSKSGFGKIVEKIARIFGQEITFLRKPISIPKMKI